MVIAITKPGTLSTIVGQKKYTETSLIINGSINSDDVIIIRDMCGKSKNNTETRGCCINLDLSNARIVDGGEPYFLNNTTTEDTIGDYMFFNIDNLQSIILPSSCKTIGECAFSRCVSLNNIMMFNNITSINNGAFNECNSLNAIKLSNTITNIGAFAFQSMSKISTITIPSMITSIGAFAFNECGLNDITFTSNPPLIGPSIFFQCDKLSKINVPSGYYDNYVGSTYWSNYSYLIDDGGDKNGTIVKSIYSGNEISMGVIKLKNTGRLR